MGVFIPFWQGGLYLRLTSANAAEIARDIYKYYFGKASKAEKKATTALLPSGSDGSND